MSEKCTVGMVAASNFHPKNKSDMTYTTWKLRLGKGGFLIHLLPEIL